MSMNGLYPIVRRLRRPYVPPEGLVEAAHPHPGLLPKGEGGVATGATPLAVDGVLPGQPVPAAIAAPDEAVQPVPILLKPGKAGKRAKGD